MLAKSVMMWVLSHSFNPYPWFYMAGVPAWRHNLKCKCIHTYVSELQNVFQFKKITTENFAVDLICRP